jgi:hypothetical protein
VLLRAIAEVMAGRIALSPDIDQHSAAPFRSLPEGKRTCGGDGKMMLFPVQLENVVIRFLRTNGHCGDPLTNR